MHKQTTTTSTLTHSHIPTHIPTHSHTLTHTHTHTHTHRKKKEQWSRDASLLRRLRAGAGGRGSRGDRARARSRCQRARSRRRHHHCHRQDDKEEFQLGNRRIVMSRKVFERHYRQSGQRKEKCAYTKEEEETLEAGVAEFGKDMAGRYQWSKILEKGGFQPGRTTVDLMDKAKHAAQEGPRPQAGIQGAQGWNTQAACQEGKAWQGRPVL